MDSSFLAELQVLDLGHRVEYIEKPVHGNLRA